MFNPIEGLFLYLVSQYNVYLLLLNVNSLKYYFKWVVNVKHDQILKAEETRHLSLNKKEY